MTQPGPARILIAAAHINQVVELRRLLEAHGHDVNAHLLDTPDPDGLAGYRLIIFDGSNPQRAAASEHSPRPMLELCQKLQPRLEDTFVPVLFITDDHSSGARLATFDAGADACLLRPFIPGELIAQVAALL